MHEVVRKAFKIAQTEKPGAVFNAFPENVAEMKVNKSPIKVQMPYSSEAPDHKLDAAAALISAATAPVILAGNGVIRQAAAESLSPSPKCCASRSPIPSWPRSGEAGVGKEVVFKRLHERSRPSRASEWVAVNCAALPEGLIEADCSDIRAVHLPPQCGRTEDSSSRPTEGRCSSTRPATYPSACRDACCAFFKSGAWSLAGLGRAHRHANPGLPLPARHQRSSIECAVPSLRTGEASPW